MIDPEQFYAPSDEPSADARRRMWTKIAPRLGSPGRTWFVLERRSFALGMAASVVVMLAALGATTAVERFLDRHRPPAVRVDNAYETAIREFESLTADPSAVPVRLQQEDPSSWKEVFQSRQEQLRSIDEGIATLRSELSAGDLSPLKRARLRDLYAKKLVILQSMLEQGEIVL